jgi:hypothetical protein
MHTILHMQKDPISNFGRQTGLFAFFGCLLALEADARPIV